MTHYRSVPQPVEDIALGNVSRERDLLARTGGILAITPFEHRIWQLELEYLRRCQTIEFRRMFAALAPRDYVVRWQVPPQEDVFVENIIPTRLSHAWIAMRARCERWQVQAALTRVSEVILLREMRGMEGAPPIMMAQTQVSENAA